MRERIKMEKPLISVVTLTYKKFDYIYKAIQIKIILRRILLESILAL